MLFSNQVISLIEGVLSVIGMLRQLPIHYVVKRAFNEPCDRRKAASGKRLHIFVAPGAMA